MHSIEVVEFVALKTSLHVCNENGTCRTS